MANEFVDRLKKHAKLERNVVEIKTRARPDQLRMIKQAAMISGISYSQFIRAACIEAAQKVLEAYRNNEL